MQTRFGNGSGSGLVAKAPHFVARFELWSQFLLVMQTALAHCASIMHTPMNHAMAENATKTLLDPWRNVSTSVLMGFTIYAGCVCVWMGITGFELVRLTRTGPWELLSMAAACIGGQMVLHAGHRFLPPDPKVASFFLPLVLVYAAMMQAGFVAMGLTPEWVYAFRTKEIHALNGISIASITAPMVTFVGLLVSDMRLSALEPGREARMRIAEDLKKARPTSGSFWARWDFKLKQALSWYSWRLPVNPQSRLLEPFVWQRVALRNLIEGVLFLFIAGLVSSILMSAGVFGDPKIAFEHGEKLEKSLPPWFGEIVPFVLIGAGNWVLVIARRWAPWINHSLTAATSAVWLAQVGLALTLVVAWGDAPGLASWFNPMVISVSIWFGMRSLAILNHRSEAIQAAQGVAAREQAVRAEAAQSLAMADLKALQAQIEPHFLYNTLANLQLLIRQDGTKADAMTGHLIDYLRARLPLMRAHSTPLVGEFDMVRSYLEILKIRMGQRLSVQFALPADCERASVPPLVVMTLVENAIKHGLEPKRGGGSVAISAQRQGDWIEIRVADTGVGFGDAAGTQLGSGVGLVNIQERLRLSFPDARDARGLGTRVELSGNIPQGVVAVLHLPFKE